MPVMVVLSDCPPKLRGDVTKWLFEINTGVYVGNISARVRENLWKRITDNIGHGHATMVFSTSGEQRMDFRVHNAYWEPVDFDGLKLMRRPDQKKPSVSSDRKDKLFSNAARRRMLSGLSGSPGVFDSFQPVSYVILDIETTGLDSKKDEIIEIGAILVDRGKKSERMQTLVQCKGELPEEISRMTGIKVCDLEQNGVPLEQALEWLLDFAEDLPFVCHNAAFEQSFLQEAFRSMNWKPENRFIDTLKMAQLLLPDLENHKLSTLANHFSIACLPQHRALADCEATYCVYTKLKELTFPDSQKNAQS